MDRSSSISTMRLVARGRGGECLSEEYVNARTKLRWQCSKGHIWEAPPWAIKVGRWCRKCSYVERGLARRKTIEEMQKVAKARGGKCLSRKYINTDTPLEWQCARGHIWEASPNNVIRGGSWCPMCSNYRSEEICRRLFEIIFSTKFPKSRPRWLKNQKGNQLELDGYSRKLGLAFEYHGRQHYEEVGVFSGRMTLKQRKQLDELKVTLCKQNNVVLIEVPFRVKFENMAEYIVEQCKKERIKTPALSSTIDHRLFDVYSPKETQEIQDLAKGRGGILLSKSYINAITRLSWRCANGHVWEATPHDIKRGTWCPKCAKNSRKLSIKEMQEIARSRGGRCLSKKYINSYTKLKWQCARGHIWKTTPSIVKSYKSWCPICADDPRRLSLEEMHEIARNRGGKCLSKEYVNNFTKLQWQCAKGHIWEAAPKHVKYDGTWCPKCEYESRMLTLTQMQGIAQRRGGKCLSVEYRGIETKLKWKCSEGHVWEATPNNVKRGTWCPKCALKRSTVSLV